MRAIMLRIFAATGVCLAVCLSNAAAAESVPVKFSTAYYFDSREFSTAAVSLSSNRLPAGFALWGFTDFHGDHDSRDFSLTRSFSEYRLSHASPAKILNIRGLAFQAELNAITGNGNDVARFGFTYKHTFGVPWGQETVGWLQWRAFPYETDNDGGQVSLIFSLPISARVQLKGFADYNVREHAGNRWVIEPELSVEIGRGLYALLEYRYNQYEDENPAIRGSAIALGFRYLFNR